jgi:ssRNA-specific RNase YbeY (16S rRNA maturation enzyme)
VKPTLLVANRQRVQRVNTALLRRITRCLLEELLAMDAYELGIHLVAAKEMAAVNWTYLRHTGSTDVITFDHSQPEASNRKGSTARLVPGFRPLNRRAPVAPTSKSAVSRVSQPAGRASADTLPIWKSAIQQVWKPALRAGSSVGGPSRPPVPHGELFICLDDAVAQAREFRTTWQRELVRYIVHGVLHLCGHDDHAAVPRRVMKREENRLLRELSRRFDFREH